MMVHDDDVTLRSAAVHLRDKASVPLLAFLPSAALRTRVKFLPKLRVVRNALQLGAVAALGRLFPFRDLAVLLNFLKAAQHRLVRKIVKLLPAKVVVAAFHVANAKLAQMLLQEWDILEEELFLQVLGTGGNNHALAAADHRQKIGQGLARSRSGFHNQMPVFNQSFFHRLRHLQLAPSELIIGVRLAEQSSGGEELMQSGQPACRSGRGFGLVGRGHGERGLMIAYPVLIVGLLYTRTSYAPKDDAPKNEGCLDPIFNTVRPCPGPDGGLRPRSASSLAPFRQNACEGTSVWVSNSRCFRSAEPEAAQRLGCGRRVRL